MNKYLPKQEISEENQFQLEFYSWMNDSHYWIEEIHYVRVCKWCGAIQPMALENSTLCLENPEILKLRK